ncbi:hypothetical protein LPJ59_006350, partial [Coemansia sp. RSA 2399]
MPTKKKGKKARDPAAYGTVSVPSSRVQHTAASPPLPPPPEPVALVAKPVTENDNDEEGEEEEEEEALVGLENQMQEGVGDKNLVDAWVSIDLARKQAGARIRSEMNKKKNKKKGRDKSGPTVWMSQKSEQLLIEQIRSEHLVLPTPRVEGAVLLSLRDWTRSANFIYETLAAYAFAEDDIVRAMAATRGAGDLVDVVAWLCFHVPADKMPVDMRDKLEHGLHGKPVKLEQPKPKETEPLAKARIDQVPVVAAVERAKEAADELLERLLSDRMLDTDGADEYESDEDPSVVHAWRVVRVNACSEILAYYRNSSVVKGAQKKANVDAIMAIVTRETKLISVLEEDVLFVEQTAAREYDRLWQEYYGPLLEDIRDLETSYHNSEKASVNPVCAVLAGQEKMGQRQESADIDILALSDSDEDGSVVGFGLDLFLGSDDEENSATAQIPTATTSSSNSTVRIVSTTEPAGWSGAAVKDLVMEVVRRLDKQAEIRYQTTHTADGYTSKLSI